MAQLYKMTLYVCDLEESLSLDEIKTLIGEQAMQGISINAICHYADEQIGERIEWDDDVDLNQWRCPTSAWDKYFTPPKKEQTNADRIRAMSDEKLAWFMTDRSVNESTLLLLGKDHGLTDVEKDALRHNIYCAIRKWLKAPAEEATQ